MILPVGFPGADLLNPLPQVSFIAEVDVVRLDIADVEFSLERFGNIFRKLWGTSALAEERFKCFQCGCGTSERGPLVRSPPRYCCCSCTL